MEACWVYDRLPGPRRRIRKRAIFWNPWRSRRIYCCIRKKRGKILRRFSTGCGGLRRRCLSSGCDCGRKEKRILRRASKRFWLLVSVGAFVALAVQVGLQAVQRGRVNELTLAGLRPGHDKISAPANEFRGLTRDAAGRDAYVWGDICMHRELRVETDNSGVVKIVTVGSNYKPEIMAKCAASVMDPKRLRLIA